MNFLADESVDHPIVLRLREDGHDVLSVAEMEPSIPDETVLSRANQRGDLLLTGDKDFGELVFGQRRRKKYAGDYDRISVQYISTEEEHFVLEHR